MIEISSRVAFELMHNRKIEAIKLLREETGISLVEAKLTVEDYMAENPGKEVVNETTTEVTPLELKPYTKVQSVLGFAVFITFVWLFINSIILIASILIMVNLGGYVKATFVTEDINFTNNTEDGLQWSLNGYVDGLPVRLADHSLASIKNISASKLRRKFPVGAEIIVLYNSTVTDVLFQSRSINIVPYTSDLAKSEMKHIVDWIKRCLLPFLGTIILLFLYNRGRPKSPEFV